MMALSKALWKLRPPGEPEPPGTRLVRRWREKRLLARLECDWTGGLALHHAAILSMFPPSQLRKGRWDYQFESGLLQRRVCELSVPKQVAWRPGVARLVTARRAPELRRAPEVRSAEVRPGEVRLNEVRLNEVRLKEVRVENPR
jgi:hypothetical protein